MRWDSDKPIKELPERIRKSFLWEANYLFNDLKNNRLTVVLAPAPEPKHIGHMIRVVESENPEWYRGLYHSIRHFRRDRSLRALNRLRKMEDRTFRVNLYKYDATYRELIKERLTEGYYADGFEVPPDDEIREFLGMKPIEEIVEELFPSFSSSISSS